MSRVQGPQALARPLPARQGRRLWLAAGGFIWGAGGPLGALVGAALPGAAQAQSIVPVNPDFPVEIARLAAGRPIREGRVQLQMPALAENGNSIETRIMVDSPMTEADHVAELHLLSEKNPVVPLARFKLNAYSGNAQIGTNVRLATSQNVLAIARMNDGSLWSGQAYVVVTIAACLDGS